MSKKIKRPACSLRFTVFEDVTIGPGQSHDSTVAHKLDCFKWVNYWILAKHPQNRAMDNISVEIVFEYPGKMGATGLADLAKPYTAGVIPTAMMANSGTAYGGFIMRAPVVGPTARIIVINGGAETYDFCVYGYATH
jgi:hypothetical protein